MYGSWPTKATHPVSHFQFLRLRDQRTTVGTNPISWAHMYCFMSIKDEQESSEPKGERNSLWIARISASRCRVNQVGDDRQREAIVTTARTGKTGASLDEIAK